MKLRCKRCDKIWEYRGSKGKVAVTYPQYVSCPRCLSLVKIKPKNQLLEKNVSSTKEEINSPQEAVSTLKDDVHLNSKHDRSGDNIHSTENERNHAIRTAIKLYPHKQGDELAMEISDYLDRLDSTKEEINSQEKFSKEKSYPNVASPDTNSPQTKTNGQHVPKSVDTHEVNNSERNKTGDTIHSQNKELLDKDYSKKCKHGIFEYSCLKCRKEDLHEQEKGK